MPADKLSEGPGSAEQQRKQGTLGAALPSTGLTGVSSDSASQTTEDRVNPSGEGAKTGFSSNPKTSSVPGVKVENTDKPY